ncbi:MAG TPA: DeoR/GlpR family DNA-binding transcription regulator [Solirubrobacterales bacterium]|nr:DeoR/GlpR family DNA-binding transcription regulator [Solirubrobacterales bacterium]
MQGATKNLSRAERHEEIVRYVAARNGSSFAELVDHFGVSQMTIYRDVEQLERLNALRRIPGGVTSQPSSVYESSLEYRRTVALPEKEAIARAALKFVEPGMSIMLDDGTTVLPMVAGLAQLAPLTVVSGFTPILDLLRGVDGIELIPLGGNYRRRHDCVVGVLCEEMLRQVHADIAFMSTPAVYRGRMLHQEQEMVGVKRAMIAACRRRVLMADHNKLGRSATHQVTGLERFDHIIVDSGIDSEGRAQLGDAEPLLEIAQVQGDAFLTDS